MGERKRDGEWVRGRGKWSVRKEERRGTGENTRDRE